MPFLDGYEAKKLYTEIGVLVNGGIGDWQSYQENLL